MGYGWRKIKQFHICILEVYNVHEVDNTADKETVKLLTKVMLRFHC